MSASQKTENDMLALFTPFRLALSVVFSLSIVAYSLQCNIWDVERKTDNNTAKFQTYKKDIEHINWRLDAADSDADTFRKETKDTLNTMSTDIKKLLEK